MIILTTTRHHELPIRSIGAIESSLIWFGLILSARSQKRAKCGFVTRMQTYGVTHIPVGPSTRQGTGRHPLASPAIVVCGRRGREAHVTLSPLVGINSVPGRSPKKEFLTDFHIRSHGEPKVDLMTLWASTHCCHVYLTVCLIIRGISSQSKLCN